jgi:hypothetical protein
MAQAKTERLLAAALDAFRGPQQRTLLLRITSTWISAKLPSWSAFP